MVEQEKEFDKTCATWEKKIADMMQKLDANNRGAATAF